MLSPLKRGSGLRAKRNPARAGLLLGTPDHERFPYMIPKANVRLCSLKVLPLFVDLAGTWD